MNESIEVTRYKQDGGTYICAGDATTSESDAMYAAGSMLSFGEKLTDMERIDGCCLRVRRRVRVLGAANRAHVAADVEFVESTGAEPRERFSTISTI